VGPRPQMKDDEMYLKFVRNTYCDGRRWLKDQHGEVSEKEGGFIVSIGKAILWQPEPVKAEPKKRGRRSKKVDG